MKNFNRGGGYNDRRGGGSFGRRDSGRSFNRGGGDRSMHKAVCDECKKDCEVPFRPSSGKPIFCSDCFSKQSGGNRPNKFGGDRDRKPRFEGGGEDKSKEILKAIKTLNYKVDELAKALNVTSLLDSSDKAEEEKDEEKPKTKTTKAPAKKKTVAKKTTKKKVATKTSKKKAPAKKKTTTKKATSKKK